MTIRPSKSYRTKIGYRTWLSDLQIWYFSQERQHLRPPNWRRCLQSAVGGVPTTANISVVAAYPCWSCCPWCSCLCFTLDSAVGDNIAAILILWYPMCSHQFWGRHLLMFQFSLVLVLLLLPAQSLLLISLDYLLWLQCLLLLESLSCWCPVCCIVSNGFF